MTRSRFPRIPRRIAVPMAASAPEPEPEAPHVPPSVFDHAEPDVVRIGAKFDGIEVLTQVGVVTVRGSVTARTTPAGVLEIVSAAGVVCGYAPGRWLDFRPHLEKTNG